MRARDAALLHVYSSYVDMLLLRCRYDVCRLSRDDVDDAARHACRTNTSLLRAIDARHAAPHRLRRYRLLIC